MKAGTLCFIGDSLIEYYDWQARFPNHHVLNLGIAGETAPELLERISLYEPRLGQPDLILIMTGTNDLLGGSDFLASYEQLISRLQKIRPAALLLANGLMPMPLFAQGTIAQVNIQLEDLALRHKIGYLDGGLHSTDSTANPPCFLEDGVHLSQQGYVLWSAAIENHLRLTGLL